MNTPSNKVKAQFFALYIDQKIEYNFNSTTKVEPLWGILGSSVAFKVNDGAFTTKPVEKCWLLLRSVDQLTDEEVILCGQIGFDFFNCIGCEYKLKVIRELNKISLAAVSVDEKTCLVKIEINNEWKLNIAQIDYLRSIGILTTFTYLSEDNKPITLSPSDLIGFGWIKMEKEV